MKIEGCWLQGNYGSWVTRDYCYTRQQLIAWQRKGYLEYKWKFKIWNLFETQKAFSSLFILPIILASDMRYLRLFIRKYKAHNSVKLMMLDEHANYSSKESMISKSTSSFSLLISSFIFVTSRCGAYF